WSAIASALGELVVAGAEELHVVPRRALPLRVAQERGRVVGDDEGDAVEVVELAPEARQRGGPPEEAVAGALAHGQEQLRPDEGGLLVEDREVGLDLGRERVAVVRRAALEDVRDVDLVALEVDRFEDLVEELPRAPDERLAEAVLVGPRRLTDD